MTSLSLIAPPPRTVIGELRAAREPIRLASRWSSLPRATMAPRTVITVPGIGTGDVSMAPLRSYLRRVGHFAQGWTLGRNSGDVKQLWPLLSDVIRDRARETATPVDLVGWSLGGVLAREVARDNPETVRSVTTYGTPVVGGPRFTTAAGLYSDDQLDEITQMIAEREQTPILPPVTAIYSKNDGVVAWRACVDPFDNEAEHVEVRSTHLGMGLDPDVWFAVADRLEREA